MFRGQTLAVAVGEGDPLGDTRQNIVGVKLVRSGKVRVVGGDDGQVVGLGSLERARL